MFDVHGRHYGISIQPIKIVAAVEVVHKKMNELRQIKSGTFFDICGPVTFFGHTSCKLKRKHTKIPLTCPLILSRIYEFVFNNI